MRYPEPPPSFSFCNLAKIQSYCVRSCVCIPPSLPVTKTLKFCYLDAKTHSITEHAKNRRLQSKIIIRQWLHGKLNLHPWMSRVFLKKYSPRLLFFIQKCSKDYDSVVSNVSSRKTDISSQICEISAIEVEISTNGDSCIESSKSTDTNHTRSLSDSNCKYVQSPVVNGADHFKQPNGLEWVSVVFVVGGEKHFQPKIFFATEI